MDQERRQSAEPKQKKRWWKRSDEGQSCAVTPRRGDLCPQCGEGRLDFDSLFVLTCPECGFVASGGAFT